MLIVDVPGDKPLLPSLVFSIWSNPEILNNVKVKFPLFFLTLVV